MLKLNKLQLIYSDPWRFCKGLYTYFDWLIVDKIIIFLIFIIFTICPQYLYIICNKPFPLFKRKERWVKKNNPEDEWYYKNKKKNI